jgi:hypothetical protein
MSVTEMVNVQESMSVHAIQVTLEIIAHYRNVEQQISQLVFMAHAR